MASKNEIKLVLDADSKRVLSEMSDFYKNEEKMSRSKARQSSAQSRKEQSVDNRWQRMLDKRDKEIGKNVARSMGLRPSSNKASNQPFLAYEKRQERISKQWFKELERENIAKKREEQKEAKRTARIVQRARREMEKSKKKEQSERLKSFKKGVGFSKKFSKSMLKAPSQMWGKLTRGLGEFTLLIGSVSMVFGILKRSVTNLINVIGTMADIQKSRDYAKVGMLSFSKYDKNQYSNIVGALGQISGATPSENREQALKVMYEARKAGITKNQGALFEASRYLMARNGVDFNTAIGDVINAMKNKGGHKELKRILEEGRATGSNRITMSRLPSEIIAGIKNSPLSMLDEISRNFFNYENVKKLKELDVAFKSFFNAEIWGGVIDNFITKLTTIDPEVVSQTAQALADFAIKATNYLFSEEFKDNLVAFGNGIVTFSKGVVPFLTKSVEAFKGFNEFMGGFSVKKFVGLFVAFKLGLAMISTAVSTAVSSIGATVAGSSLTGLGAGMAGMLTSATVAGGAVLGGIAGAGTGKVIGTGAGHLYNTIRGTGSKIDHDKIDWGNTKSIEEIMGKNPYDPVQGLLDMSNNRYQETIPYKTDGVR